MSRCYPSSRPGRKSGPAPQPLLVWALVWALGIPLVLAGCGRTAPPAVTAPTPTPSLPAPSATSATPTTPPCVQPASQRVVTVPLAGVRRTAWLSLPRRSAGSTPLVLVVALHGYHEATTQFRVYTGLTAATAARDEAVAFPDGVADQWNFPRRAAIGPDDVAFLDALVRLVSRLSCGRQVSVTATGFSDGADMADTWACSGRTRLRLLVAVAPSVWPAGCARPPRTVLEVHGTADPIVPFAGGGGDRPPPFQGTEAVSVATRLAGWRTLAGCHGAAQQQSLSARSALERWSCRRGSVGLVTVQGGGHTWPGAPPWPALGTTDDGWSLSSYLALLARS